MGNVLRETPCVYKKSCGYEVCMMSDCGENKPKKRGEPFYGEEAKPKKTKSQKAKASRNKGKVGEREVVNTARSVGFTDAHRTQQFCGNSGDAADVEIIPGFHFEVKRCENIRLPEWKTQAEHDCGDKIPVVCFRRSNEPWRAVMPMIDFFQLVAELRGIERPGV